MNCFFGANGPIDNNALVQFVPGVDCLPCADRSLCLYPESVGLDDERPGVADDVERDALRAQNAPAVLGCTFV